MNLTKDQLEAILINDDILNKSKLQTGAMETSDRKIVEYIYRMKTEGAADPRLTPSQSTASGPDASPAVTNGTVAATPSGGAVPVSLLDQAEPDGSVSNVVARRIDDISRAVAANQSQVMLTQVSKGGDNVTTNVDNSKTTFLAGGASPYSGDVSHRRQQDKMNSGVA